VNVDDWMQRFRCLPGIGDWTAQYVAMRALGEPDAFPVADLGLLHATALRNPRELESRSQNWRPWRAYAAMYLWQSASVPLAKENNLDTNVKRTNRKIGVKRSNGATGILAPPSAPRRQVLAPHARAVESDATKPSPLQRTAPRGHHDFLHPNR
jgi:hypothetical protein